MTTIWGPAERDTVVLDTRARDTLVLARPVAPRYGGATHPPPPPPAPYAAPPLPPGMVRLPGYAYPVVPVYVAPPRPPRSAALAFLLAFLFGPLGLFYLGAGVGLAWCAVGFVVTVMTLGLAAPLVWCAAVVAAPVIAAARR